ncbi:hypothetical protein [Methylobacterium oryzae]|uniref:Uncharacterized protein n=1 Tax=Methylobacterium oryzae TaxID=334852 RepID=A0ABU7TRE7_9HYPH
MTVDRVRPTFEAVLQEDAMPDERELPEGVPPATEDIGLPTPPSPGRLPPLDLPPAPDPAAPGSGGGDAGSEPDGTEGSGGRG